MTIRIVHSKDTWLDDDDLVAPVLVCKDERTGSPHWHPGPRAKTSIRCHRTFVRSYGVCLRRTTLRRGKHRKPKSGRSGARVTHKPLPKGNHRHGAVQQRGVSRYLGSIRRTDRFQGYVEHSVVTRLTLSNLSGPTVSALVAPPLSMRINASCEPWLKFVPIAIGSRCWMVVIIARDINTFKELAIGYGDNYWLEDDARVCQCNELNCRYSIWWLL